MKITTWNVNGMRAALNKGFYAWAVEHDCDVLCLQEVKAFQEQIPEQFRDINQYKATWNSAKKAGYSGVLSYSKTDPAEVQLGLGVEEFDNEGRVIRHKYDDFYLYNIYFPNGQRGQDRVDFKLAFYSSLLEECKLLLSQGENIIITGDFNTAHTEIDLANPKENAKTSGFLPEERAWIIKFLENGFRDAYRELYPDRVEYTWWTYRFKARERNIGWRLDYFLVNEALMPRVKDVKKFGVMSWDPTIARLHYILIREKKMSKQRILLVDDHEVVRLGLKSLLDRHPQFDVVGEAGTAKEALDKVTRLLPDVVLMDIRLPGTSGIEACEEITRNYPDIKVVMLTSYAEDEMLFSAIRAGASGYVLKQIGGEDLVRAIEQVGRGEAALDPAVTQRVFQEVRRAVKEEEASAFINLSQQEKHVLLLVSEGKTNREIAKSLFLGEGTVRNYVSSILSKLGVSNRAEAAAYAVEHNLREYL